MRTPGRKPKKLFVVVIRLTVWTFCLLAFAWAFELGADGVSLVSALTFTIVYALMARVYGGFDIGVRTSRAIAFSMLVAVLLSDLAAHLFLCILRQVTEGGGFRYDRPLLLLAVYAAQAVVIVGMAYLGNGLFFAIKKPQRCLAIVREDGECAAWLEKITHEKRRFTLERVVSAEEGAFEEKIAAVDAVLLYHLTDAERTEIVKCCYRLKKDLYYSLDLSDIVTIGAAQRYFEDTAALFVAADKVPVEAEVIKRAADILLSCVGLVITSPLLLITALAVKLEDGGSVLYRQKRATQDGRVFEIIKFRSMHVEASEDHRSVTTGDRRITRVGRVIRKFRIDELPQFVNVLRGDMSLVGPRPEMLENMEAYTEGYPEFSMRLRVKAGMTGLAQIYGRYNSSPRDKAMFDLLYIQNFSLWLDVKIILRTVLVLLQPGKSTAAFEEKRERAEK